MIVDEKEDYITVMGLSGHKDIRMLKKYSHTHEDAKKSAIEKLGKHITNSHLDAYMDTKGNEQPSVDKGVIALTNHNY